MKQDVGGQIELSRNFIQIEVIPPHNLVSDLDKLQWAIEKQTYGSTMINDLYNTVASLQKIHDKYKEKADDLIYVEFSSIREDLRKFKPHIVVLYLDMPVQKKIETLKLVSQKVWLVSKIEVENGLLSYLGLFVEHYPPETLYFSP